jgi:hypothetical protein
LGGRKRSKRKSRRASSAVLMVMACGFGVAAVAAFHAARLGRGFDFLGLTLGAVGMAVAFTWPVSCRVLTVRGRECRNEAGGVLFGCHAPGHKLAKFRARIGLRQTQARPPAAARQPVPAAHSWVPDEALPIVITVAGGAMGACAFWFGLITTATGVASVALAAAQLH